jgi:asparagine synthetase B (glutamine-hydrolysing)
VIGGSLGYFDRWQLPPTSPNMFFWFPLLEQAAADGIRVLLDGEGGDQLFGMSPYLLADRLRRARFLGAVKLANRMPGTKGPQLVRRVGRRVRRFGVKGAAPAWMHVLARRWHGPGYYAPKWMRPDTAKPWLATEPDFVWKYLDGPRWWAFQVDAITRMSGNDLVYNQSLCRGAMLGIEPRHPLVDVDVVEFMLSLPPELSFDPRYSRPLLRDAMAGLIPDPVRLRPAKSSFDAIFHQCLAGRDLPLVRRLLGDRDARIGAYVDLPLMRRALIDPDPPGTAGSQQLWAINVWRLLTLEIWLRTQESRQVIGDLYHGAGPDPADLSLFGMRPGGQMIVGQ